MILSITEMVKLLRDSVNIQYDDSEVIDPAYLSMTDEDIIRFIKLGINRIYPEVESLEDLPPNCSEYAIILLSKIELYLKLAVLRSEKIDLGADNNNYIKNSQRFDHYMKLVEEARQEYESWLDNEGNDTVSTYEILNTKYSHTKRYYENQLKPSVSIKVANVTSDSFDFEWGASNISHFGRYAVYMSKSQIFNKYADGSDYKEHIIPSDDLVLLRETYDIRNNTKHIGGLEPNTTYYIFVVAQCRNGVWGSKETSLTTLEELTLGEEIESEFTPTPTE